jgi:hypothetical protein
MVQAPGVIQFPQRLPLHLQLNIRGISLPLDPLILRRSETNHFVPECQRYASDLIIDQSESGITITMSMDLAVETRADKTPLLVERRSALSLSVAKHQATIPSSPE